MKFNLLSRFNFKACLILAGLGWIASPSFAGSQVLGVATYLNYSATDSVKMAGNQTVTTDNTTGYVIAGRLDAPSFPYHELKYGPNRSTRFLSNSLIQFSGGYVSDGYLDNSSSTVGLYYGSGLLAYFDSNSHIKFSGGYVSDGYLANASSSVTLYYGSGFSASFLPNAHIQFSGGYVSSCYLATGIAQSLHYGLNRTAYFGANSLITFSGGFVSSGYLSGSQVLYYDAYNGLVIVPDGTKCVFSGGNYVDGETHAPVIVSQPVSRGVVAGQTVAFSVVATGTPVPTFQWKKNGLVIAGATGATYSIVSTALGDAGSYTVDAVNSVGVAISWIASLTVTAAPIAPAIVSQPTSWNVMTGQSVSFSVVASGTAPLSYQWRKNGVNVVGATGSTYSIASAVVGDAGSYAVMVTNSVGNALSNSATLSVNTQVARVSSDFNGDGKGDILLSNTVTGDRSMWLMNGSTVSNGGYLGTIGVEWVPSGTGDFNGDGKADIIWTNTNTGERSIWLMNGTTVITGGSLGVVPLAWVINGTGDFNGDGKTDVVLSNTVTGDRVIWLMNGTTIATNAFVNTTPVAWVISGTGDFNGDGKADILLSNTVTGDRSMWLMNGSTVSAGAYLTTVPVEWVVSGTDDFNGDGKADVIWTNTNTGERSIWLMNGTTISTGSSLGIVPVAWVINGVRDFNGDGKADVILSNTTTGDRVIWLMNGTTIATNAFVNTTPVAWVISR